MDDYSQMTPEQIQQLAELLSNEDSIGQMQGDIKYNRNNRLGSPQGRMAGNVYVAGNPLEHLGNALQDIHGIREDKKLKMQIDALRGKNNQARAGYMQGIQKAGQMYDPNDPYGSGGGGYMGRNY
jgi:hypothetical protein